MSTVPAVRSTSEELQPIGRRFVFTAKMGPRISFRLVMSSTTPVPSPARVQQPSTHGDACLHEMLRPRTNHHSRNSKTYIVSPTRATSKFSCSSRNYQLGGSCVGQGSVPQSLQSIIDSPKPRLGVCLWVTNFLSRRVADAADGIAIPASGGGLNERCGVRRAACRMGTAATWISM